MSKQMFKSYPKVDVFFKTSDDQYFFSEHDANGHAASLEDKKVEQVNREEEKPATKADPAKGNEPVKDPESEKDQEPAKDPAPVKGAVKGASKGKKAAGGKQ